nr:hypothetical protein CFP56_69094 [Quercus suber]
MSFISGAAYAFTENYVPCLPDLSPLHRAMCNLVYFKLHSLAQYEQADHEKCRSLCDTEHRYVAMNIRGSANEIAYRTIHRRRAGIVQYVFSNSRNISNDKSQIRGIFGPRSKCRSVLVDQPPRLRFIRPTRSNE